MKTTTKTERPKICMRPLRIVADVRGVGGFWFVCPVRQHYVPRAIVVRQGDKQSCEATGPQNPNEEKKGGIT